MGKWGNGEIQKYGWGSRIMKSRRWTLLFSKIINSKIMGSVGKI
jgi:hypothetical protein